MALSTKAVARKLRDIMGALSGVGSSQIAVPESSSLRLTAYVTMASQSIDYRLAGGITQRTTRFLCEFAYRVDGDEVAAEETLMDTVDAFLNQLYADPSLGNLGSLQGVDLGLADTPEYQTTPASEYRRYPIVVSVQQRGTFTVAP